MQTTIKQTILIAVCLLGILTGMVYTQEQTGSQTTDRAVADGHQLEVITPEETVEFEQKLQAVYKGR